MFRTKLVWTAPGIAALAVMPSLAADGKQHVGGLGLPIGQHVEVGAVGEVDVVEDDG
jgi:hypothetical protein